MEYFDPICTIDKGIFDTKSIFGHIKKSFFRPTTPEWNTTNIFFKDGLTVHHIACIPICEITKPNNAFKLGVKETGQSAPATCSPKVLLL